MKLTVKQIDRLQANRETDILVAQYVMGWRLIKNVWWEPTPYKEQPLRSRLEVTLYSRSWDLAMEVAKEVCRHGFALHILHEGSENGESLATLACFFESPEKMFKGKCVEFSAETGPLAICKASLGVMRLIQKQIDK